MAACSDDVSVLEEAQEIQNIETELYSTNSESIDDSSKDLPETKTQKPTIMVLGKTGRDKSTLIYSMLENELLEKTIAKFPLATNHAPITFFDTRGYSDDVSVVKNDSLIHDLKKLKEKVPQQNVETVLICPKGDKNELKVLLNYMQN